MRHLTREADRHLLFVFGSDEIEEEYDIAIADFKKILKQFLIIYLLGS